jgi:hypothetical protein
VLQSPCFSSLTLCTAPRFPIVFLDFGQGRTGRALANTFEQMKDQSKRMGTWYAIGLESEITRRVGLTAFLEIPLVMAAGLSASATHTKSFFLEIHFFSDR